MRFMRSLDPLSLLILRVVLAVIFIYHGYPKLAHPSPGLRDAFVSHGLPAYFVTVSGILECFGSLLLLAGIFTRPAALLLAIEMGIAIWKMHSGDGIMTVKVYEFPLVLAASCFVLATIGPGAASFDHVFFGGGSSGKRRRFAKAG
jgi:uncharacterized membrane protein YphA (DoxX/SURF4 family)